MFVDANIRNETRYSGARSGKILRISSLSFSCQTLAIKGNVSLHLELIFDKARTNDIPALYRPVLPVRYMYHMNFA